jgi:3',5'-cyclic AMP phosphodiesterase CpdA
MANNKDFKIVHLSDLHLTSSDRASRSEPKLFGSLRGMNAAFRKLAKSRPLQEADLILITGDVTDRGDIGSWLVFWEAIKEAGLAKRVLVVPGNHDMCCLGWRLPNKGHFARDLRKAEAGLKRGLQPIRFPWVKVIRDRVAIFGLNSNNYGNWSPVDNAIGNIGEVQLNRLNLLLKKHKKIPVKIVALHHSPNIPGAFTAWRRKEKATIFPDVLELPQMQRRRLRQICRDNKVKCIVHGHVHIARDRRVQNLRIIGANAATEPDKNVTKKRYSITGLTIKGRKGRVYREVYKVG